jgi:hypothetical protein
MRVVPGRGGPGRQECPPLRGIDPASVVSHQPIPRWRSHRVVGESVGHPVSALSATLTESFNGYGLKQTFPFAASPRMGCEDTSQQRKSCHLREPVDVWRWILRRVSGNEMPKKCRKRRTRIGARTPSDTTIPAKLVASVRARRTCVALATRSAAGTACLWVGHARSAARPTFTTCSFPI